MNAPSTMGSKRKKALSRSLSTRRHRSLFVSDRCYHVIIDQFIRVRMRQQSVANFSPLSWDRERSRKRSWTRRFLEVSGVNGMSAHESARGLDTAIVSA